MTYWRTREYERKVLETWLRIQVNRRNLVVDKPGNYMASVHIGARPFHGLHLLHKESSCSWVLSQRLSVAVAVAHPPGLYLLRDVRHTPLQF